MTEPIIRVLIADDQDIVRAGLTMLLDAQPGIAVIAQAADGRDAVALVRRLRPDVCLFDIRMPGMDGIEATRQVAGPDVAVVVITTFDLDEYVHAALKAKARGSRSRTPAPPCSPRRSMPPPPSEPVDRLTDREEEVLLHVARDWTNAEIADGLHSSISTVKTHLASLLRKLDARNRVEVAMWAYETHRVRA